MPVSFYTTKTICKLNKQPPPQTINAQTWYWHNFHSTWRYSTASFPQNLSLNLLILDRRPPSAAGYSTSWRAGRRWCESTATPPPHCSSTQEYHRAVCSAHSCTPCSLAPVQLQVSSFKFLRVHITNDLSWSLHMNTSQGNSPVALFLRDWRSLAWTPASSQTSTGAPLRARCRTASRSGTGTALSTAASHNRK